MGHEQLMRQNEQNVEVYLIFKTVALCFDHSYTFLCATLMLHLPESQI